MAPPAPAAPNDFRGVYPQPVFNPDRGARALRNAPWTLAPIASPFGWHDTNGAAGAEYTITRGNNVYASEDVNADNLPGFSPNSATLDFDYPLNLANAPSTYQSAAITNLFLLEQPHARCVLPIRLR
ncbi:MAG: M36 family metallopeptidase [Flavobacteriales bacterium]|nr:M36 family metallopeptidase [Flavobacteriales bacterium]